MIVNKAAQAIITPATKVVMRSVTPGRIKRYNAGALNQMEI
jgi:hypothetical protein